MTEIVIPPDFEWVSHRAKCSASEMFDALRVLAQRDVDQINTLRRVGHRTDPRFRFTDYAESRRGFTITDGFAFERRSVDFALRKDVIHVNPTGARATIQATLTLNDKGECRFKIGDDELEAWQVLRRGLEWLFFDPADGD